jgi:hypothetical protein
VNALRATSVCMFVFHRGRDVVSSQKPYKWFFGSYVANDVMRKYRCRILSLELVLTFRIVDGASSW